MPDLLDLLEKTSRTFALSIPPLPEPTRREVTVAYLLFRIADTFEDATHWPPADRIAALGDFTALLGSGTRADAERLARAWTAAGASPHAGYRELIAETPFVFDAFRSLSPEAREILRTHVSRSAEGMAGFVARTGDEGLVLGSLDDLRGYCYTVAGIVGELLTELFLLEEISLRTVGGGAPRAGPGVRRGAPARQHPEGLRGRRAGGPPLPARLRAPGRRVRPRAARPRRRGEYIEALHGAGAPAGILEFTALPVALAWAALARVEEKGPGAKVGRPEVFRIAQQRAKLDRAGREPRPV